MYLIYTPSGTIETDSFNEVLQYQAEGCTYEKIPDEHSPESVFEKPEPKPYRITGEAFVVDEAELRSIKSY